MAIAIPTTHGAAGPMRRRRSTVRRRAVDCESPRRPYQSTRSTTVTIATVTVTRGDAYTSATDTGTYHSSILRKAPAIPSEARSQVRLTDRTLTRKAPYRGSDAGT